MGYYFFSLSAKLYRRVIDKFELDIFSLQGEVEKNRILGKKRSAFCLWPLEKLDLESGYLELGIVM